MTTVMRRPDVPLRRGGGFVRDKKLYCPPTPSSPSSPSRPLTVAPAEGSAPQWLAALGPSLVGGAGPRTPSQGTPKNSQWPHGERLLVSEISLKHHSTGRRRLLPPDFPKISARGGDRCNGAQDHVASAGSPSHASSPQSVPLRPRSSATVEPLTLASKARGEIAVQDPLAVPTAPYGFPLNGVDAAPNAEDSKSEHGYSSLTQGLEFSSAQESLQLFSMGRPTPGTTVLESQSFEDGNTSSLCNSSKRGGPLANELVLAKVGSIGYDHFSSSHSTGFETAAGHISAEAGVSPPKIQRQIRARSPTALFSEHDNVEQSIFRLSRRAKTTPRKFQKSASATAISLWPSPFVSPAALNELEPSRLRTTIQSMSLPSLRTTTSSSSRKDEPPLRGKEESKVLLGKFYDLRRAGLDPPGPESMPPPRKEHRYPNPNLPAFEWKPGIIVDADDAQTLMMITLGREDDTVESLQEALDTLQGMQDPIADLGGKQRATTLVSMRTLQVVQRKQVVLKKVTDATMEFEVLCGMMDETIERLVRGEDPKAVLGLALDLKGTLRRAAHSCDPRDADRLNWEKFIATFKLPHEHNAIKHGVKLMADQLDPWLSAILAKSKKLWEEQLANYKPNPESVAASAMKRMIEFAELVGFPHNAKKLDEASTLATTAKASAVCVAAEADLKEDTKKAAMKENGTFARTCANRIYANIKSAAEWGVEKRHPSLARAKGIAHELLAEGCRRFAIDQLSKKTDRIGAAEAASNRIEDTIREAAKLGCPIDHEKIVQARKAAKDARDEEGIRKRQLAAEQRKKENEAKQAAAAEAAAKKAAG